jgi:hypothetical protein
LLVYTFISLPVIRTSCKYFTPTLVLPPQGGGEDRNENTLSLRGRREEEMTERKERWIPDCSGMT